jgi:hypothetical protein
MTTDGLWIPSLDLLTTHAHQSEVQVITAPPLIPTIHSSPQHPLSFFPACCFLTSRSLATASNSGDSSASRAQVLYSLTLVQNCLPTILLTELDCHSSQPPLKSSTAHSTIKPQLSSCIITLQGPNIQHHFQQYLYCIRCCDVFTQPLPRNERLIWLHYTGLQASCHNINHWEPGWPNRDTDGLRAE